MELEAEGPEAAISAFLRELETGQPRAAHVSGIKVEEIEAIQDFDGFRITY